MFCSAPLHDRLRRLGDGARDALAAALAFLTLDDGHEAPWDDVERPRHSHPHRVALRSPAHTGANAGANGRSRRRPGALAPAPQHCTSPVRSPARRSERERTPSDPRSAPSTR